MTDTTPIPNGTTGPPSRIHIWSARLGAAIEVMFFIEIGLLLLIFPWISRVWMHNSVIVGHAWLEALIFSGFFRGLVSGLGLLNLGYGVRTAFTYQDPA